MVLRKSFRVWRKSRPRSVLLESKEVPDEALLFEADAIAILSPVEVEIIRREYSESTAAYGCLGVLRVNVDTESFHYLVLVTECQSVGKIRDVEVFRITQTTFAPLSSKANMELVQEVGKLLACGRFYFSFPFTGTTFDLLACAQKQGKEQPHFFWNRALFAFMRRFGVDCERWLYRVMCGTVEVHTVYAGDKQAKVCLISRINCERAGTRFNVRGTNDEGHVGNFVETEQAIYVDNSVSSFVQIRGLVPLFWEQPGLQSPGGMIRIKFSRGYTCSQPAFERHFEWCLLLYGPLLCVNLLGTRNQEQILSYAFREHLQQLSSAYCADMVCFDYHQHCRGGSPSGKLRTQLLPLVEDFVSSHGFFISNAGTVEGTQTGTMRTNCLDCLDRTNSVQTFFGTYILPQMMAAIGLSTKAMMVTRFTQLLSPAWAHSGDNISKLYAGTRALGGKTKLRDGARSVQRTILNNFLDSTKQEAIDMLLLSNAYSEELGQKARALLDPVDVLSPVPFKQALVDRWSDFTTPEKVRVCIGTWNVNGGKHIRSIALRNQSMHDWLLDAPFTTGKMKEYPDEFVNPPDIFAIGFQELVGLTASNIVSASSSNRREWGAELQRVLSRDHPYELLTAEQLVGICLYVFIRPKLIPYIRDVAVSTVKTGMSGKAGNKGAVAIRFLLHATSICFVCSHFAAHQSKVGERNQDFADICKKVQFSHGQTLYSHDHVFWCGDLNYRIDLPVQEAKDHIVNRRWDKLRKKDQLYKQKKLNKVFVGFIEGEVNFAPTYKYDEFSDDYDTSEKCRVPAWCDRILWRRRGFQTNRSDQSAPQRPSAQSSMSDTVEEEDGEGATPRWDFGLHPSDAAVVCGEEMTGGGGGGGLVNTGHPWHPGRLLHYGRAELKQSDHRPVVALLEVDVYRLDHQRRAAVRREVLISQGPPDPTITVVEEEEGEVLSVPLLLETLKSFGEVVLVRVTDDATLVTFRHSQSALAATGLNGKEVDGVTVQVWLRSPWPPDGSGEGETGGRGRREGHQTSKRPERLKVLTSGQLTPGAVGGREFTLPDEPTELSFTEEPQQNEDTVTARQGDSPEDMPVGDEQSDSPPGDDVVEWGPETESGMEPELPPEDGMGMGMEHGEPEPEPVLSSSSSEENLESGLSERAEEQTTEAAEQTATELSAIQEQTEPADTEREEQPPEQSPEQEENLALTEEEETQQPSSPAAVTKTLTQSSDPPEEEAQETAETSTTTQEVSPPELQVTDTAQEPQLTDTTTIEDTSPEQPLQPHTIEDRPPEQPHSVPARPSSVRVKPSRPAMPPRPQREREVEERVPQRPTRPPRPQLSVSREDRRGRTMSQPPPLPTQPPVDTKRSFEDGQLATARSSYEYSVSGQRKSSPTAPQRPPRPRSPNLRKTDNHLRDPRRPTTPQESPRHSSSLTQPASSSRPPRPPPARPPPPKRT